MEIGTGYSCSCLKLAELVGPSGKITSLDRDPEKTTVARKLIAGWRRFCHHDGIDDMGDEDGCGKKERHCEVNVVDCDASSRRDVETQVALTPQSQDAIIVYASDPEPIVKFVLPYLKTGEAKFGLIMICLNSLVPNAESFPTTTFS